MNHKKIAIFAVIMIIVFGLTVLVYPYIYSPKPVAPGIPEPLPPAK